MNGMRYEVYLINDKVWIIWFDRWYFVHMNVCVIKCDVLNMSMIITSILN